MPIADLPTDDPEHAVLVAAVRDAATIPEVIDEVRMAALARWHRLEGVLARVLPAHGVGSGDLHDHLAEARTATETRAARLRSRLADLVDAWDDAGIEVVLLKGAALVESGLVAAGERPMADLDVLVDAAAASRAAALARTVGFAPTSGDVSPDPATTRHQLPALYDGEGTTVEVHRRLLNLGHPQRRLDDLARTRTVGLSGTPARRLDDVALWLHVAVHCWDDRRRGTGGPLLQLRDLQVVLARLDPHELIATTRRVGAVRLVATVAAVLEVVCPSPAATTLRRELHGPLPGDEHVTAFVRTRILGRRSPVAQLVHPTVDVAYTPWRLATRARRQLWPGADLVRRVHGPDATARDHLASLVPAVRDGLVDPGTVWRDLRLDRWAHDVVRSTTPP